MKVEFFKDDNGNIWFYYASNIQTRSRYKSHPSNATIGVNVDVAKSKGIDAEDR